MRRSTSRGAGCPEPEPNPTVLAIVGQLAKNAKAITFGSVSVTLKIHGGRLTGVVHTVEQNTRENGGVL